MLFDEYYDTACLESLPNVTDSTTAKDAAMAFFAEHMRDFTASGASGACVAFIVLICLTFLGKVPTGSTRTGRVVLVVWVVLQVAQIVALYWAMVLSVASYFVARSYFKTCMRKWGGLIKNLDLVVGLTWPWQPVVAFKLVAASFGSFALSKAVSPNLMILWTVARAVVDVPIGFCLGLTINVFVVTGAFAFSVPFIPILLLVVTASLATMALLALIGKFLETVFIQGKWSGSEWIFDLTSGRDLNLMLLGFALMTLPTFIVAGTHLTWQTYFTGEGKIGDLYHELFDAWWFPSTFDMAVLGDFESITEAMEALYDLANVTPAAMLLGSAALASMSFVLSVFKTVLMVCTFGIDRLLGTGLVEVVTVWEVDAGVARPADAEASPADDE